MSVQSRAVPFVKSIFHPSDFSEASELAFAHALAIALIRKTQLVIMHARRGKSEDWSKFPAVRKTLARWQVLQTGNLPAAVFKKLGVKITKVSAQGDPLKLSILKLKNKNRTWSSSPHAGAMACRSGSNPLWLRRSPVRPMR